MTALDVTVTPEVTTPGEPRIARYEDNKAISEVHMFY